MEKRQIRKGDTHKEETHTERRRKIYNTHRKGTQIEKRYTRRRETHKQWTHTARGHREGTNTVRRYIQRKDYIGRDYIGSGLHEKRTTRKGDAYKEGIYIKRRLYWEGTTRGRDYTEKGRI